MTFSLWDPPLPVVPISSISTDKDRLIGGRCWDLPAVQQALADGSLSIELTTTATEGAAYLGWRSSDVALFLKSLKTYHYINSQWCMPPADGNHFKPLQSDAYQMGFSRIQGVENPRLEPYLYIKWGVRERAAVVMVFSFHESTR
ncbi:type II toxin-antitoxin system MqsR family toxin [Fluviibacter phosphoraccumulans]|uniref:Uncharacterized protein n=1 Tax=Fluviibacter phosphoraccumulans TaxID=1751046 RepID=A0A7R6R7Z3_9RHOO|nr:type II toxin-antitoxin system MqsR family toxin [Fluviibacter phosphoraccumulans]BBU69634.1 hypothetical protein ICHIAU1_19170 [Fluviibacter phosphoraccumulans]BBU71183.1 hypothetical protein ICHIJ1_11020 [Fluviibacter phosphoraccumulans]